MGGTILSTGNDRGSAADTEASTATSNANFKAFSGKGQSIGGDPVRVPLCRENQQERNAAVPENNAQPVANLPRGRGAGAALLAKLEA